MAKDLKDELIGATPVYGSTPTLSKIKMPDVTGKTVTTYYLKDADARNAIDVVAAALDQEISDRSTADTGLQQNIDKKQDKITSTNKLDADLLKDGETNKVYTATEQTKLAGISTGANKVEATAKSGKISIDGTEVQIVADNTVVDANYKHITVTDKSVSDGTTTFNKYDDTALKDRVTTAEGNIEANATAISNETSRATGVESGLETRIENLEARGRFLSGWNVGTGKPSDYPSVPSGASYPYTYSYKTGDYYIVTTVPAEGSTKYKPDGASITKDSAEAEWTIGTATETEKVIEGDFYIYSKTGWLLLPGSQKTIYFSNLAGNARDNTNLKGELEKVDAIYYKKDAATAATGLLVEEIAARIAGDESLDSSKQDKITSTSKLNADLVEDGTTNKVYTATEQTKLSGIETGAQVNVIEHVKMNGSDLTITDKRVDLGNVVPQERKIAGCTLTADIAVTALQGALGLEELAYSDTASGSGKVSTIDSITMSPTVVSGNATVTYASTTISSTGKFTPAGTVSVTLTQNSTDISSTGSYQPEGSVNVTLLGNTFNKIISAGTTPSYTPATLKGGKATVVDISKFVAGTTATLSAATSSRFVKKAIKMEVDDDECLVFSNVADTDTTYFADAITDRGTFTGNSLPSIPADFVTAGIDVDYTDASFDAGSLPTFEENTVSIASASFTGTTATITVAGKYDKATVNTAAFEGTEGDISVSGTYDKADSAAAFSVTVTPTVATYTRTEKTVSVTVTPDKA